MNASGILLASFVRNMAKATVGNPKVGNYMTPMPRTIGEDIPLSMAKSLMRKDNIRHLPVLQGGRLVGIVSDRDIKVAESFPGPGELTVGEIMTPDPYVVEPSEPLDAVLTTMADRKLGCTLIHQPGSEVLIGIFTDTDALRIFGEFLRRQEEVRAA